MIKIENLHISDTKAYEICVKHINKSITAGVNFLINMCKDNVDAYADKFRKSSEYANLFPKGFEGDRLETIEHIRDMIECEEEMKLSLAEKYILMACLEAYYKDCKKEYTLENAAEVFETEVKMKFFKGIKGVAIKGKTSLNIFTIADIQDRLYVLSKMTDEAFKVALLEDEEKESLDFILTYLMSEIEDLSHYKYVCFDGNEYELLGQNTKEELLSNPATQMFGLEA